MSVKKRKGLLLYDGVWYSRIFEDGRFAVPQSLLPDGVTPKFYRAFVPFDDKRGEIRFERIKNLPLKENMKNNKKIYNNRFVIPQKIREIYGLTNGIFLKIEPYYTGMDDGFSVVYDEKMSDSVRKTIEKIYYS